MRTDRGPRRLIRAFALVNVLGSLFWGTLPLFAESVVAPPAPAPVMPEGGPGATGEVLKKPTTAPLQWGIVAFRPHVDYRLTYGDGVQSQPGAQTSTTINTLSPGLAADIGERWTADYTPTWTFYSSRVFSNTVAHSANLSGRAGFTDGTLQFSQTYNRSNDPLIETGRQTRLEGASTGLAVNYALGQQTRVEATVGYALQYAERSPDTKSWTTNEWFHYQFSSRLDTAVGVGFGLVNVDPGADMRFIQPQARIGWRPLDKVSFDVHAGREHRTFKAAGLGSLNSPTYGASVQYQPIEVTSFTFGAERGISASFFADQITENSSWNLGFDQRLLEKFHLSGGYSRSKSRYMPTAAVFVVGRDDRVSTFHLRLGTTFLRRGTIGLVYQRVKNSSNVALYTFSSDQTGIEIGYRY